MMLLRALRSASSFCSAWASTRCRDVSQRLGIMSAFIKVCLVCVRACVIDRDRDRDTNCESEKKYSHLNPVLLIKASRHSTQTPPFI
jgi:hypothetical protein